MMLQSDIDKTLKIFQLARSLSIFRVDKVWIYHDRTLQPASREKEFLITILEYLDTPQYLRRKIYPRLDILKSVGRIHPIRSPHHKEKVSVNHLRSGEIRVGFVEKKGSGFIVDVGLDLDIKYNGNYRQNGKKISVKLVKHNKQLYAIDADSHDLANLPYWGYTVDFHPQIKDLLRKYENSKILLTSKYAKYFDILEYKKILNSETPMTGPILLVFGSPKFGLNSIFESAGLDIQKFTSYNFFPSQGTQTIRLEEAIFGVLAILNYVNLTL